MDSYRWFLAVLAGLCIVGCRSGVNSDVLERELRLQEDRIFALEDKIDEYRAVLDLCRADNQRLRRRESGGQTDQSGAGAVGGADFPSLMEPPMVQPGVSEKSDGSSEPPVIDMVPFNSRSFYEPAGPAERIALTRLLVSGTYGQNFNEGITVVVEPSDARGQVVDVAGEVSLMVVDPMIAGPRAQIARWDFTPAEVARRRQASEPGDGVHFELSWPEGASPSSGLELWARLVTTDGRKLLTHRQIGAGTGFSPSLPVNIAAWQGPGDSVAADRADDRWSRRWSGAGAEQPAWQPFR